jgi:hypothetical protein
MAINSKRAEAIDAYNSGKKGANKRGLQKVEISGKIRLLESYLIPLDYLLYNHDNRRFNLEIQDYETQIDRKLDPTLKSDAEIIQKLLLKDNLTVVGYNTEAEKLYNDLKLLGEQREVAAITHDGIVVNGNRRMATLERLHKEEPTGKWNELWVVRLPEDISEKDLWKIEAGLQLSKEKVADYGPVNNLLMIKEGHKAGLSHSEIAASMYGWTEKQVGLDLERLTLIDIFLEFFGQPHNYGLIKKFRLHEHFEDIQKGLTEKQKKLGLSKKALLKKLEIVFLYLRASILNVSFKFTHYDTREICKILQDDEATFAIRDSFEKQKDLHKIPVEKLTDNFDKAVDVRKNREDKEKPGKLIDRALSALNGIDRKGKSFKEEIVKKKLRELDSLVKDMKTQLGIK